MNSLVVAMPFDCICLAGSGNLRRGNGEWKTICLHCHEGNSCSKTLCLVTSFQKMFLKTLAGQAPSIQIVLPEAMQMAPSCIGNWHSQSSESAILSRMGNLCPTVTTTIKQKSEIHPIASLTRQNAMRVVQNTCHSCLLLFALDWIFSTTAHLGFGFDRNTRGKRGYEVASVDEAASFAQERKQTIRF